MNIDEELAKVGLSCEEFEECLQDIQDKLNGINDMDWEEIRVKYDIPYTSELLRKANSKPFGGAFVREYFAERNDDVPSSYTEQLSTIRKERQRLFDERAALNKINRENSRIEQQLDYLEGLIKQNAYSPAPKTDVVASDNDLLIAISDVHLGLNVDNNFGAYNTCIANQRMEQYLAEIKRIQKIHGAENAYVCAIGDLVSGLIHSTVQLENRENAVQQIQIVSEMISNFVYELSKTFKNVYVNSVAGNHSRLNQKKENVLRDERLDDLCLWYMKAKLGNLNNVYFVDDKNYDATIGKFDIRGKEYLIVHGDFDSFSESGISKLVMMLGKKPEAMLCGHLHRCSLDEVAGIKIMRSGSFAGTADNYTISKRISGKPSQLVCVVDDNGVQALYPVQLR